MLAMSSDAKNDLNLQPLQKPIQEIINFTEQINERYREKCFELLVNYYLLKEMKVDNGSSTSLPEGKNDVTSNSKVKLPIDVRAFLHQNGIADEIVQGLFLTENEEIRPTYKITTTKKSTAQIQIALLAALENAVKKQGNKFEFSKEDARARCNKFSVYDKPNFMAHFKNNAKLFKSLDDDLIELSPAGQTELAEVITLVSK